MVPHPVLSKMGVGYPILSCTKWGWGNPSCPNGGTPSSPGWGGGVSNPFLDREVPHHLLDRGIPHPVMARVPPPPATWKGPGTSRSIMGWRWGTLSPSVDRQTPMKNSTFPILRMRAVIRYRTNYLEMFVHGLFNESNIMFRRIKIIFCVKQLLNAIVCYPAS